MGYKRNRKLGGSAMRITSERPRGARMDLKDYCDNDPVRSRGQDLVSTRKAKKNHVVIRDLFFVNRDDNNDDSRQKYHES